MPEGPLTYHIVRVVVQHSKTGRPRSEMGHNPKLPHRNIGVRLCSVNRHTIAADCQRISCIIEWLGPPHARSMLEYTRMFRFRRSRLGTRLSRMVCDIISEVGESIPE